MAVVMTLEVAGGTTAQYDRTNEILGIAGEEGAPPGLISHVCAVTDDGIVVVDVWDSVGSLDEFMHDRLSVALAEAGMPPTAPRVSPVHDFFYGTGKEPNMLVLLRLPHATTDAYDDLVAKLPSHAGNGAHHPSVVYVAAAEPDAVLVAALWESEPAYMEFWKRELLPHVDNPRYFVLRVWPVHACLLARPHVGA